jgi:TPR repeat protein
MMIRLQAFSVAAMGCIAFSAIIIMAMPTVAHAQSADLVLCDRLAADPSDPDKPADVKGTPDVATADVATAIKYCKVASASSRRALYQLGRAYAANRQLPEAMTAWRKAADKGSTSAMVELGVAYGTGSGVARDESQARKLFERAAEAGNPRGVTNLAALSGGGGAPADPARARQLLAKAAETNAEAQYQLGLMMANGTGGAQDDAGARNLFEKAAAQNHPGALERMGAFTQEGRGGPKDAGAAKAYYERAAALGDEDAKKALKRMECPYAIKDKRGNFVTNLCF